LNAVLGCFERGRSDGVSVRVVASNAEVIMPIAVTKLDNVLRPLLIRRGADLPLLLIFAGVIGGLLAFGIIGLFVGPVALAVAYTLLKDWVADQDRV